MTIDTSIPEYAEKLAEDHPVRIYLEENLFLKKIISEINFLMIDVLFTCFAETEMGVTGIPLSDNIDL